MRFALDCLVRAHAALQSSGEDEEEVIGKIESCMAQLMEKRGPASVCRVYAALSCFDALWDVWKYWTISHNANKLIEWAL